jgi:hypothetical protein
VEPFFSSLVREIEDAYERLGHNLGWRFLYSPARTLAPNTPLALVGTNPGGDRYEPPSASVEDGNAYRYPVETWPGGSAHGPNRLQRQVVSFYRELAGRLPGSPPERLMDDTLAVNFCPFRSPSWESLPSRPESVAFSRQLWTKILEFVNPAAVICLGQLPATELGTVLSTRARLIDGPEIGPVGWRPATYEMRLYASSRGSTLLVRLPHLSRFAIFGRAASQPAVDRITHALAGAIVGSHERLASAAEGSPHVTHSQRGSVTNTAAEEEPITAARDERGRYPQPRALVPARGRTA